MTLESINSMTMYEIEQLNRCIEPLEAQEALIALKIAHYPHLEKNAKRRVHNWFADRAYPEKTKNQVMLSSEAAAKILAGKGLNGRQ